MPTTPTIDELQARFPVSGLRFVSGPGGLIALDVSIAQATGRIYLHGAHVAAYQRTGGAPVIFMSERSFFQPGKPIRGGVPIAFPWFGPRQGDPAAPIHGLARSLPWDLEAAFRERDGSMTLQFSLQASASTGAIWPHGFSLRYRVTMGRQLRLALQVSNPSPIPFSFQEALHTYFAVADVRNIAIHGLEGAPYADKTASGSDKSQGPGPIRFGGETDRLYVNTRSTCVIEDPGLKRRLTIAKENSDATVVWNPWIVKAKAMPDFGDDEWPRMVCVETVNTAPCEVKLFPGQAHEMVAVISEEAAGG